VELHFLNFHSLKLFFKLLVISLDSQLWLLEIGSSNLGSYLYIYIYVFILYVQILYIYILFVTSLTVHHTMGTLCRWPSAWVKRTPGYTRGHLMEYVITSYGTV
jgi:hypothetical protein